MLRALPFVFLLLAAPALAAAQEWNPPSAQMPMMPSISEIRGDWMGPRAEWFRGLNAVAGVGAASLRASGDPGRGDRVQIARFSSGPLPVVIWSDRNGDERADVIEIYRSGGVVVQVIDADYDGRANVIRRYDESGTLLGQERL